MPERHLRAYFFTLNAFGDAGDSSEEDYLWDLFTNPNRYQNGISTVQALNSQTNKSCELREIQRVGNVVKGCLALLRDERPPVRRIDRTEVPLPMNVGATLLEKNYFLYFKETRLLVWHFNLSANHVANMGLMLSTMGGMNRAVSYTHVVKNVFALDPDQTIEYVDLKIRAPRRKTERHEIEQLDPTDWGFNPFKVMSDTGARNLEIVMQNRTEDGLLPKMRRLASDLTGVSVTSKLKVKVDGAAEPIDMLAERFTYRVAMQCADSTPSGTELLQALQGAKDLYDAEQAQTNHP